MESFIGVVATDCNDSRLVLAMGELAICLTHLVDSEDIMLGLTPELHTEKATTGFMLGLDKGGVARGLMPELDEEKLELGLMLEPGKEKPMLGFIVIMSTDVVEVATDFTPAVVEDKGTIGLASMPDKVDAVPTHFTSAIVDEKVILGLASKSDNLEAVPTLFTSADIEETGALGLLPTPDKAEAEVEVEVLTGFTSAVVNEKLTFGFPPALTLDKEEMILLILVSISVVELGKDDNDDDVDDVGVDNFKVIKP